MARNGSRGQHRRHKEEDPAADTTSNGLEEQEKLRKDSTEVTDFGAGLAASRIARGRRGATSHGAGRPRGTSSRNQASIEEDLQNPEDESAAIKPKPTKTPDTLDRDASNGLNSNYSHDDPPEPIIKSEHEHSNDPLDDEVKTESLTSGTLNDVGEVTDAANSVRLAEIDEELATLEKEISSVEEGTHSWLAAKCNELNEQLESKMQVCTCRRLAEIQKVMNTFYATEHEIAFNTKSATNELKDALEKSIYYRRRKRTLSP